MSQANTPSFPDFGKLVPGFDFLQNLTKQASGSANQSPQLPNLGGWIAPTLNVEELDKRIQELKAVQFWLDQNAAALKATIQALELQKMTLATLKGMNFNMADMANAFMLKTGDSPAAGAQSSPETKDKPRTFAGLEIPPSAFQAGKAQPAQAPTPATQAAEKPAPSEAKPVPAPAASVVDPMQWWGALTQQFQTIAAEAMKEVARTTSLDASKNRAAGLAKDAVKTATDMATGIAKGMADSTGKALAGSARAMSAMPASSWPKPDVMKAAPRASAKAAGAPATKSAARSKPKAPAARKSAGAAGRKTTR